MSGQIVMVALGAVVAGAPAHSAHAHLPLSRHVAAASSFGVRPRGAVAGHHRAAIRQPAARSASDPAVTIADFHFSPPTTTVHVGDTITWTNDGPSSHTATAKDGSFNTGKLSRGQSASHTFTKSGTYAYVCTIHPFMHGTITVLATATAAPTPSTTSSTPAPATTNTTTAPSSTTTGTPTTATTITPASAATAKPTLPVTGMDVLGAITAGTILLGCGLALRRAVAP
jgi:plastocyanin